VAGWVSAAVGGDVNRVGVGRVDGNGVDRAGDGGHSFARHGGGLRCVLNTGKRPLSLPDGEVLLASAPTVDGKLPANAAAWLASTPISAHNP